MAIVFISGGSNLGNRSFNLMQAARNLEFLGRIEKQSSLYETEPVGFPNQSWFLNVAWQLETGLTPLELLTQCRIIERKMGRERLFLNAPRTLDLDILLYDQQVIHSVNLVIPHPRMNERKFVLIPLSEIAPAMIHPVVEQTIASLLKACPDTSEVRFYR